jgi:hypothetical protein
VAELVWGMPTVALAEAVDPSAPAAPSAPLLPPAPSAALTAAGNVTPNAVLPKDGAPHWLEITFGSGQLFLGRSIEAASGKVENKIVPVTAALLMAEWLFHRRFSAIGLFTLPLETQKTVENGQVREEYVAPSLALGVRGSLFSFAIFRESAMELQVALLAGRTFGSLEKDRFFPLAAGRLHFHTHAGFTLYLGNAFAFAKETHVLLYGIGYRF